MSGFEKLYNTGIHFVGNEADVFAPKKTLVVMGVARGGTSLISGALEKLGVFTGEQSTPPVYEDIQLATAFEKNDLQKVNEVIERYNSLHDIWAFKRPSSINYCDKMHKLLRNPVYLFIFKDMMSVSKRNSISMKYDFKEELVKSHKSYEKIINFIAGNELNAYFFSYDKIMQNKELFVDLLIKVVDPNIGAVKKQAALKFITPNPRAYLNVSRVTLGAGRVEEIDKFHVKGWGKYISSVEPAEVELYVNDKLVDKTIAKNFRKDLVDNKMHSTGHCGYVFQLKDPLKNGDKISVKLSDDVNMLQNSNQIWKEH